MGYDSQRMSELYNYFDTLDIVDLLHSWGHEKKSHRNYFCIGHSETNPSMFVDSYKNIWHCFSCGKGGKIGDLIAYYVETEYGIEDKFKALEYYLGTSPEIQSNVGFSTLKVAENVKKEVTLADLDKMLLKLELSRNILDNLKMEPMCYDMKVMGKKELFAYLKNIQESNL